MRAEDTQMFAEAAASGRLVAAQFTAPLAALALVPALALPWLNRRAWPALLLVFAALFCFAVVVIVGANPQRDIQNTWVARVVFLPSFALVALLIGAGWAILWHGIAGWTLRHKAAIRAPEES